MRKTALIFGINGQDGYYLARRLLSRHYRVVGAGVNPALQPGLGGAEYVTCDISSESGVAEVVDNCDPDVIYNLAVFLGKGNDETDEARALEVNVNGPENVLKAIEARGNRARFFQASSGYIFRPSQEPKSEDSPMFPANLHARTKLEAHRKVAEARGRGVFAVNGILFGHESPKRPLNFLVHKVTRAVAEFKLGLRNGKLRLGSLSPVRDWGYAGDFVAAMHLMLQAKEPKDYVVATGKAHSVRDVCRYAFNKAGLDYSRHIEIDPELQRAPEISTLVGNPSLIRKELGWRPATSFTQLIALMVKSDLDELGGAGLGGV